MLCEFDSEPDGRRWRHSCRRCHKEIVTDNEKCVSRCLVGIREEIDILRAKACCNKHPQNKE